MRLKELIRFGRISTTTLLCSLLELISLEFWGQRCACGEKCPIKIPSRTIYGWDHQHLPLGCGQKRQWFCTSLWPNWWKTKEHCKRWTLLPLQSPVSFASINLRFVSLQLEMSKWLSNPLLFKLKYDHFRYESFILHKISLFRITLIKKIN